MTYIILEKLSQAVQTSLPQASSDPDPVMEEQETGEQQVEPGGSELGWDWTLFVRTFTELTAFLSLIGHRLWTKS